MGDGGGDPSLLPVLIPPNGWLGDPNDADGGMICGSCATTEEIANYLGDLAAIEAVLDEAPDDP